MRAYRRQAAVWVTLVATLSVAGACQTECRGPACESAYPQGRVDLLDDLPLDGRTVDIDGIADGAIVGSVVSGSAFSVAATPTGLVVGQPDARTVREIAFPDGDVTDEESDELWVALGDGFGQDVAVLPHLDGVGWSLVVAAPGTDRDRGTILVFHDAHLGVDDPSITLRGAAQGDRLGTAMRTCPDRDGDGLPELLVTAPWMQPVDGIAPDLPPLAGAAMLIDSTSLDAEPGAGLVESVVDRATLWWGAAKGDSLGTGLDCATDLDGDGAFDIVLGAPTAQDSAGEVYVVASSDGFTTGRIDLVARETYDGNNVEMYGASVATFVHDDVPQLLVGLPGFESGRGAAIWYDATRIATTGQLVPVSRFESESTTTDHYGRTVGVAELDGDGWADLLIGGPDRRDGQLYDVGQLLVFLGATERETLTNSSEADLNISDDQGFRRVGRRVVVEDFDQDGIDELLLPTRSARTQ